MIYKLKRIYEKVLSPKVLFSLVVLMDISFLIYFILSVKNNNLDLSYYMDWLFLLQLAILTFITINTVKIFKFKTQSLYFELKYNWNEKIKDIVYNDKYLKKAINEFYKKKEIAVTPDYVITDSFDFNCSISPCYNIKRDIKKETLKFIIKRLITAIIMTIFIVPTILSILKNFNYSARDYLLIVLIILCVIFIIFNLLYWKLKRIKYHLNIKIEILNLRKELIAEKNVR